MKVARILTAFAILAVSSPYAAGSTLEGISDEELDKLITSEKYVVVLAADGSERSQDLEAELASLRGDLVDSLNAWVVKTESAEIRKRYSQSPGPAVVFFRSGFPVLYDGAANEDEMLETIGRYKEVCVQDLTDTSFEHLTQASTGATTGDWLVFFFKDEDCQKCKELLATVETLACKHKGRINVARVNRGSTGAVTGRRFGVQELPALIFFRLGKMYRYELDKLDVASLSSFITGWYKNVKSENIPVPKSPFDDLVQMCVDYIRENPVVCAIMVGVPVLLLLAFTFLMSSSDDYKKPKSKKKSKKKVESAKKES